MAGARVGCRFQLYGAKCAIKDLIMPAPSNFASVKLPLSLVEQAREAAQPLRRSAAGQIEYWATLGRVVEHSGLTVQEAQTAIEAYETAARRAQQTRAVADLTSRLLAAEVSGSLAQRVREVVEENRKLAS
jgi:cytochrome c-type biogenesis protein CcmH/NrfG